jgi:polyisoprenoid-binding protein YceI
MKTLRTSIVVAFATLLTGGSALASDWEIDPSHTTAQFSVKHMMVTSVRGTFDKVSGSATLDDKDLTRSSVEVVIDAASINTREPKRDAHLRSPDFFDVAKNPHLTFKSTKVEKAGKGKFKVTGDLTMRGVTRPVVLTVEGPTPEQKNLMGKAVRGLVATGKLNRKEWGLTWNKALEAGGVLVGDEVQLQIDAELVQKASSPTAAAK